MADVRCWPDILFRELTTLPDKASTHRVDLVPPSFGDGFGGGGSGTDGSKQRQQLQHGYRIITLDPPWANKSADRGKQYSTKAWELLPDLPIPQLAASPADSGAGSLVAVWVTNKSSYWDWLVNTVFPRWGVWYITTWFWLKVCDDGNPVMPIDSHRERKPFEPLVIGVIPPTSFSSGSSAHNIDDGASCANMGPTDRSTPDLATSIGHEEERSYWLPPWRIVANPCRASSPASDRSASGHMHVHNCCGKEQGKLGELWRVPLKQVFCSVPMVHSAKPHLDELLNRCFTHSPHHTKDRGESTRAHDVSTVVGGERLELFARCLRTVSTCGNT